LVVADDTAVMQCADLSKAIPAAAAAAAAELAYGWYDVLLL
jgi:hypothetical protein